MPRSRTASAAFLLACLLASTFAPVAACDSDGDDGPSTKCQIPIGSEDPSKLDFGERCQADEECAFGTCLLPGEPGNATNALFGFCTRGCDCNDDPASNLTNEEKDAFVCLRPMTPDQHRRHVVLRCSSLGDCTDIDAEYSDCAVPQGSAQKVCFAGVEP